VLGKEKRSRLLHLVNLFFSFACRGGKGGRSAGRRKGARERRCVRASKKDRDMGAGRKRQRVAIS